MLDAEMRNIDGTNMPPREDETDTIYEYAVSDADLEWVHWRHMVPTWEYPRGEEKPKFAQLVIPTLDRTTWSLTLLPRRHVQVHALWEARMKKFVCVCACTYTRMHPCLTHMQRALRQASAAVILRGEGIPACRLPGYRQDLLHQPVHPQLQPRDHGRQNHHLLQSYHTWHLPGGILSERHLIIPH
eukprot:scaffold19588_cov18-Tisochrysis_lutea.AAC.1